MINLYNGDCLEVLKNIESDSIDSVVTDPPYGLAFMGKKWDYDVPSVEIWKEVLRVLKPGGHLLSFGGTRTYHRMVINIEDAGFEIRDQIMWIYGSGFPKSQNVALAIDKQAGAIGNRGKGFNAAGQGISLNQNKELRSDHPDYVAPEYKTDSAKQWQGWGTALKPANEPICLARKPISEKTVASNVLKHGTGAMNIDESRVGVEERTYKGMSANKPDVGTFRDDNWEPKDISVTVQGRWPANVIFDEEAGKILDEQSGHLKSGHVKPLASKKQNQVFGEYAQANVNEFKPSEGGASRFFYCAKTSKSERGSKNFHPTVKPIKLMSYLIKLITPPNGIVLDPFMGSGSTGLAAKELFIGFVGIERDPDYFHIAERRINNENT